MKVGIDPKGLGKRIVRIPRIYKLIIILLINIAIGGLLFYLFINPQFEEKERLLAEYEGLKREMDKMVAIKNNMAKYRKEYAELQEVLQQVLKQLPETKDIPNLLRNVSNAGTEASVKITYFSPKPVTTKEFYAELPFDIRFTGPYHNIGYFFDSIRRLERIINITNYTITLEDRKGSPNTIQPITLNGLCTAITYVYLKDQPKKPGKK